MRQRLSILRLADTQVPHIHVEPWRHPPMCRLVILGPCPRRQIPPESCASPAIPSAPLAPTPPGAGPLPEWNLTDLYPRYDARGERDLDRAERMLASRGYTAARGSRCRWGASRERSAHESLAICSFGHFVRTPRLCGQHDRPVRAKFTAHAGAHHCFSCTCFLHALDNRPTLRARCRDGDPALGTPSVVEEWQESPMLEDLVMNCSLESVTGAGAWNRLFDETSVAAFEVDSNNSPSRYRSR